MSTISLHLESDMKTVFFHGNTYSYRFMIQAIPGNNWNKKLKRWELPLDSVSDALRIFPSLFVDAAVHAAFRSLHARQQQAIAVKTDDRQATLSVPGLKGTLRTYQGRGLSFLKATAPGEGGILGFDMGTGKTLSILAFFLEMKNKGLADHLLVVCPSPLKYATWAKEIAKWTDLSWMVIDGDYRETIEWDDGTTSRLTGKSLREVQYQQHLFGSDVMVMNYELFLHDFESIPEVTDRWIVALDEAHRIKNPRASTTKNLIKKLRPAGRKILATGTPLENNVQELWSLVDFCRPNLLGNYHKFMDRYIEMDFFNKPIAPKPQMMRELQEKLAPILIRVTKKEALPELPPAAPLDYWVGMTKEQEKLYKDIKAGIIQNMETQEFSYLEMIVQITRMQQVLDSPALLRELVGDPSLPIASGKLNELRNVLSDLNPAQNKFILFSQYKEMTDILYTWLTEDEVDVNGRTLHKAVLPKHQVGYVKGGIKPLEIERVRKAFQEADMQCVLMTTAGNYGLDLSAGKYVICFDQLFNPQKMEQIYSRAHRGGNTGVTLINFVTKNSYEEKKLAVLEGKREVFKAMIDSDDATFAKLFTKQDLINMI